MLLEHLFDIGFVAAGPAWALAARRSSRRQPVGALDDSRLGLRSESVVVPDPRCPAVDGGLAVGEGFVRAKLGLSADLIGRNDGWGDAGEMPAG